MLKKTDYTYQVLLAAVLGLIAIGFLVFALTYAGSDNVAANYGNKSATATIVDRSSTNQTAILLSGH